MRFFVLLRLWRVVLGLTVEEAADVLVYSPKHLSNLMRGDALPADSRIPQLAEMMSVDEPCLRKLVMAEKYTRRGKMSESELEIIAGPLCHKMRKRIIESHTSERGLV